MANYLLPYFIEGENTFGSVEISEESDVFHLQLAVQSHWNNSYFKNVDAGTIPLLKVKIEKEQHGVNVTGLQAPEGAMQMHPGMSIQRLWPHEPSKGYYHFCARLLTVKEPPLKRPWKEELVTEQYLEGNLARLAPSTIAKHPEVMKMQNQLGQRIANDRPNLDADLPPIALLYHGFGHFLDVATGATDPTLDINQQDFEDYVDDYMTSMSEYFAKESGHQKKVLSCLNNIFDCGLGDNPEPITPSLVQPGQHSDGHVLGSAKTIEVVVEVKNELGTSGADPIIEFAAYYTQSLLEDSTRAALSQFFFPALGIVVIGSHIGFYALAFTGRTRLVALTPLLPTVAECGNTWVRPALLNAFRAACVLRHHINKDTKNFSDADKESLPIQHNLPYVKEAVTYSQPGVAGPSASVVQFCILQPVYQGKLYPNRFLYLATRDGTDRVIVKFTRQYCLELHSFCAQRRCAPQLLGYNTIPGGWHVVVMEWINQEAGNVYTLAHHHLTTWTQDLKSLVKDFHDQGLVHGDLRDANLIVRNDEPSRVMLVDFDWGGRVDAGPVYPTALINDELKKANLPGDLRITKEHDDGVLARTLTKLATQF